MARGRWIQLVLGVIAMLAISSPQYVWTLFVAPFREELKVSLAALQVTFALFSIFQCGLGPLHGKLASLVSPRLFVAVGGLLVGLSWIASAQVRSLPLLYLSYGVLSGVGTGFVYVAVAELMVRYFPDRRGFAVGMAAGSYGFGAILTTFPIAASLKALGFEKTLTLFGAILAAVIVLAALGMKRPPAPAAAGESAEPGVGPATMLRSPAFWLMFVMMTMVATGGLMAISQLGPIATSLGVTADAKVMGLAALPLALTLDRLANGFTRPFFGWISDRIGREPTMALAFTLEAAAVFLLMRLGGHPVAFVLLSALVFFGWGEIYSLFPSLQADVFGSRYAVQNVGWLVIGTAIASVLGAPVAAWLVERTGSWTAVFWSIIALDLAAALMAITLLAPMRRRALSGPDPGPAAMA